MITTDGLRGADRFEYWRSAVSDTFVPLRAEPARSAGRPFRGRMRSMALGALQITEVCADAHAVYRTPRLITASGGEYFKLGLQLSGGCVLSQDGREATLAAGDFAIYDTTRPYSLSFVAEYRQLVVMLPRPLLGVPLRVMDRATARRLSGQRGFGALAVSLLRQLPEHQGEFEEAELHRLGDTVSDLVAGLVTAGLDPVASADGSGRGVSITTIRAYIEDRLGDPDLGPEGVAAAHYVSTRHLHRLFQEEGTTVSGWIRQRRLEHCRRELGDPTLRERPVGAVAARWGLTDAARFSRTFRRVYGCSPREYRAAALG
ncbi:helix-turn-helix domain-containing protein [Embleya hyalina]|uniref:AraC-like ligand-binding domain-containing protein n=1 Tax=Embleya hyalina TaxID=516124 RepID=UPI001C3FBC15|nr:helix-turn-helix domain-containing protein [Embleya hyalina]